MLRPFFCQPRLSSLWDRTFFFGPVCEGQFDRGAASGHPQNVLERVRTATKEATPARHHVKANTRSTPKQYIPYYAWSPPPQNTAV